MNFRGNRFTPSNHPPEFGAPLFPFRWPPPSAWGSPGSKICGFRLEQLTERRRRPFLRPKKEGGIIGRRRTTRNSRETNRLQLRELNIVLERKYLNVERVASIRRALRTGRYRYLNEKATRVRDQNAAQRVRNVLTTSELQHGEGKRGGNRKTLGEPQTIFGPKTGGYF